MPKPKYEEKGEVGFQLAGFRTSAIEYHEPNIQETVPKIGYQVEVSHFLTAELDHLMLGVKVRIVIEGLEDNPILEIEVKFVFVLVGLEAYKKNETEVDFPQAISMSILSSAISTMRGILAGHLGNTLLGNNFMPIIDIGQLLPNGTFKIMPNPTRQY